MRHLSCVMSSIHSSKLILCENFSRTMKEQEMEEVVWTLLSPWNCRLALSSKRVAKVQGVACLEAHILRL